MSEDDFIRYMGALRKEVREAVRAELNENFSALVDDRIDVRMRPLADALGKVNDSKTGGTGLAGELARQGAKIDQLFTLRNIGTGIALSLSVTGALIWLGLKQIVVHWTGK